MRLNLKSRDSRLGDVSLKREPYMALDLSRGDFEGLCNILGYQGTTTTSLAASFSSSRPCSAICPESKVNETQFATGSGLYVWWQSRYTDVVGRDADVFIWIGYSSLSTQIISLRLEQWGGSYTTSNATNMKYHPKFKSRPGFTLVSTQWHVIY